MGDMFTHEGRAWVANNPLHMLAALGTFLLTDDLQPGTARLSWHLVPRGWEPRFHTPLNTEAWIEGLTNRLQKAGATRHADPAEAKLQAKAVRDGKAELKKALNQLKAVTKVAKEVAKKEGLKRAEAQDFIQKRTASAVAAVANLEAALELHTQQLSDDLGLGPAHLGDLVGVEPAVFRRKAKEALGAGTSQAAVVRQLAALASDACVEAGRVKPTPFSFSNGGSSQYLLKDFRALTHRISAELLGACLSGLPHVLATTPLNWDPADQRNHALQWRDPKEAEKAVDVVSNALAFMGLGALTAVPGSTTLGAVGFSRRRWTWPVWQSALPVTVVRSLLASGRLQEGRVDRAALGATGVSEVYRAERLTIGGQRYFFAPAEAAP